MAFFWPVTRGRLGGKLVSAARAGVQAEHCGFAARPIAAAGEQCKISAELSFLIRAAFVHGGGGGRTTCNSISSMKTSASGTILPVSCCRRAILAGCGRDRLSQPCAHAGGTACLEGQLVPLRTESILRCALVLQRVCDCEMFSPADCVLRFVDMKVHMSLSSF